MGIFPLYGPPVLIEIFEPIAKRIETETAVAVRLLSAPDFSTFKQRCMEGSYDLVWINNAGYLEVSEKYGFQAVAVGYPPFRGVVMVDRNSGIDSIKDLQGKSVVAVGEYSIAGYLFFRNKMADLGLYPPEDYSVIFKENMEVIPFLVINGEYDAAVFSEEIYFHSDIYKKIEDHLKIIDYSIEVPQFPFAVASGTDPVITAGIQKALISVSSDTEDGREILAKLHISGIRTVDNSFFDDFRTLYHKIKSYNPPRAGD